MSVGEWIFVAFVVAAIAWGIISTIARISDLRDHGDEDGPYRDENW